MTKAEHMPSGHRWYKKRKPLQLIEEAGRNSTSTAALSEEILRHRANPEAFARCWLLPITFLVPRLGRDPQYSQTAKRHSPTFRSHVGRSA